VSYREVNEVARAIDAAITVVSLEPSSIEGILETITTVGAMTEAEDEAIEVVEELRERLAAVTAGVLDRRDGGHRGPRVVAVEWLDPPFASGHWVPEQVRRAGGWELLGQEGERSVETTWSAIAEVDPDRLVLMPCGYHVDDGLAAWRATPRPPGWDELTAVRTGNVRLVDGSAYFSRPGPRVVDGIELLAELFDPDGFPGLAPDGAWLAVD
jgi:iron complex transport system substrate-binding protein